MNNQVITEVYYNSTMALKRLYWLYFTDRQTNIKTASKHNSNNGNL